MIQNADEHHTGKTGRERDAASGTETTGHEWDGIKELDTPLPRWWLWTFYATIVWGIAYTIAYPAWPLITSATDGLLGYDSRQQFSATIAAHKERNAGIVERITEASFEEIRSDPDLDAYAFAGGAALFRTNCSQCHGAGAAGAPGYPNLLDDEWLWGGSAEEIYVTLQNGIRWEQNEDTRFSLMPNFGADEILSEEEIETVTDYVLAISEGVGPDHPGAEIYLDNCSACHGEDGAGVQALGAPNLANAIWLYGGDRESVITQIYRSRHGVMPAWSHRLVDGEIKQLSHYVHSLGGGQ